MNVKTFCKLTLRSLQLACRAQLGIVSLFLLVHAGSTSWGRRFEGLVACCFLFLHPMARATHESLFLCCWQWLMAFFGVSETSVKPRHGATRPAPLVPVSHLPTVAVNQQFRRSSKSCATCWYLAVSCNCNGITQTTLRAIVRFVIILRLERCAWTSDMIALAMHLP